MAPNIVGKKRKRNNNNNIKTTTTTTTENTKPSSLDEPSTNIYHNLLPEKISDQILRLKKPYYNEFFNKHKAVFTKNNSDSQDGADDYILEVNELLNTWEYQYICSFMYCVFPSFFTKDREQKNGLFGSKRQIMYPPKLLRDIVGNHIRTNNPQVTSSRVSARQQKLNMEREQELVSRLEEIDIEKHIEYGPDQRKFHELLLVQDLLDYTKNNHAFKDDVIAYPEYKADMFAWLLLDLGKIYYNDMSFGSEQGDLLKHKTWFDFDSVPQQGSYLINLFKQLFEIIKICELKSYKLKNYIVDNADLFYFPKFDVEIESTTKTRGDRRKKRKTMEDPTEKLNDKQQRAKDIILSRIAIQESYMLMHGGKILKEKRVVKSPLMLPLKQDYCLDDEGNYMIDFKEKIEEYTNSIEYNYDIESFDFDTLLQFNSNVTEFYDNNIATALERGNTKHGDDEEDDDIDDDYTMYQAYQNFKYGLNLFNNRMRVLEVESFFNNQQTSKMFLNKISEKKKRKIEEEVHEKSAKQKIFLNKANYQRNKYQKLIREYIMSRLWAENYKINSIVNEKGASELNGDFDVEATLRELEKFEIFNKITSPPVNIKYEAGYSNLPFLLVWKDEDLNYIEENDIYLPSGKDVYSMNWGFHCSCDSDKNIFVKALNNETSKDVEVPEYFMESLNNDGKKLEIINNEDGEDISKLHERGIHGDLVSCIKCNRWGHFKCLKELIMNDPDYKDMLAVINQMSLEDIESLNVNDLCCVNMGEDVEEEVIEDTSNDKIPEETLKENIEDNETSEITHGKRAVTNKKVDYTGKDAYNAIEESRVSRRRTQEKSVEEEFIKDGRPSFLKEFPLKRSLEQMLNMNEPITKLCFKNDIGEGLMLQEDLDIILDTIFDKYQKIVCYECVQIINNNVNKEIFPIELRNEKVRLEKKRLQKMKRLEKLNIKKKVDEGVNNNI
ncbi:uncharacterized protein HGUI_02422 [Hanseniaspora guilliermondii]|uniref:Uncharacterized protein n=1 Tax=Hanseniaspora guilliermondii TaxID=56406 RepID=A0A1L0FKX9_9ASCO|nr:uncharacterized protein HGUI_02422 [Hanseniaspora guilliermondii]